MFVPAKIDPDFPVRFLKKPVCKNQFFQMDHLKYPHVKMWCLTNPHAKIPLKILTFVYSLVLSLSHHPHSSPPYRRRARATTTASSSSPPLLLSPLLPPDAVEGSGSGRGRRRDATAATDLAVVRRSAADPTVGRCGGHHPRGSDCGGSGGGDARQQRIRW